MQIVVMNRRHSKNRIEPLPQAEEGFSPRRGLIVFLITLFVVGPIMVGTQYLGGGSFSLVGSLVFIVGLAVVAGIIGLWTDKLPF